MRKRTMVLTTFVVAGWIGTSFALASPPGDDGKKPDAFPKGPPVEQIFNAMDSDGDGMISKEEFEKHFANIGPAEPAFSGRPGFGPGFGHGPMMRMEWHHRGSMGHAFGPPMREFGREFGAQRPGFGDRDFRRGGPGFAARGFQRGGPDRDHGERGLRFEGRGPRHGGPEFDGPPGFPGKSSPPEDDPGE